MAKVGITFWADTGIARQPPYEAPGWIGIFTGWYFPKDLREGNTIGFLWPHSDRFIYYGATISAQVFDSNRSNFSLGTKIAGNMWPLLRESGKLFNIVSGEITQDNRDQSPFRINLTGQVSGDNIDKPDFHTYFSGAVSQSNAESGILRLSVSGEVSNSQFYTGTLRVSISGALTKPDSTGMSLDMSIYEVIYGDTPTYSTQNFEYTGNINFRLYQLIYSNAS